MKEKSVPSVRLVARFLRKMLLSLLHLAKQCNNSIDGKTTNEKKKITNIEYDEYKFKSERANENNMNKCA